MSGWREFARPGWRFSDGVVGWRQKPEALFNVVRPRPATHWRTGVKLARVVP